MNKKEKLYIIIPAYNEEDNIEKITNDWYKIVNEIGNNSKLIIIDDGSQDNTYKLLCKLKKKNKNLVPITKKNEGHGATIMYGYKYAIDNNATYIFQTDSDGQTDPNEFWNFWELRNEYDAIIGSRKKREDGIFRIITTKVLRLIILLTFHVWVEDSNTPFRLINIKTLRKYYYKIPKKYNLSNVLLTILIKKNKDKIKFIPITFKPRQAGINSINIKKIVKIGFKSIKDFIKINKELKRND